MVLERLAAFDALHPAHLHLIGNALSLTPRFSHEYTRTGLLFHLPLPHPTLTLHLSITKLHLPSDKTTAHDSAETSEPYLVQLHPSKPIPSVTNRGEVSLADVVDLMRSTAGRVDGLEWGTGR